MKRIAVLISAVLLLGACSLEIEGPGWENEAPDDFAGFQWRGDGDFAKTVSLPAGVLAWCWWATRDGDGRFAFTWTEDTGSFAQLPIAPAAEEGYGSSETFEAIEVTAAGNFTLTITASGVEWDASVKKHSNECPWS